MPSKRLVAFIRRLRRFFLTTLLGGVVVVLPITLLIVLVRFVVQFTASVLAPMRPLFPFSNDVSIWLIDLISLALVLTAFFFIGLVVQTRIGGRFFTRLEERWLMQLPFYSIIRETVRQFLGNERTPFSQVVLVDAFGSGVLMTGFVSDDTHANGYVTVFVPTGPNPTNGFVLHAQRERLTFVDTKPEDAMRTIIGVGTGSGVLFAKGLTA